MLIGEFAKRIGVKPDTVRFYEKVGFFSQDRRDNGYRVYTEHDIETADLIATGKAMGFSLREIQVFLEEMKHGSPDHQGVQQSLKEKIALIDSKISSLEKARKLVEEQIEYCRQAERREQART
jgi:MerR family copper efflux transcriptional regulator